MARASAVTQAPRDPLAIAYKAVNLMPAMLAYWDVDQRCVFASASYATWFGRDAESMQGLTLRDFLGPIYPLNQPFIEAVLAGEPQQFERELPTPDGGVRYALASYIPDIEGGVVRGFIAHVTDITVQHGRQQALQRSAALLERIGALAHVGGAELDLRTNAVFWTDEMCRILDVDPSQVPPPERWAEFFEADALAKYLEISNAMISAGTPVDFETPMITATGRRIWVRIQSTAVRDEHGQVVKLLSAHQDITARKATEAVLHATDERLRRALEATQDAIWDYDAIAGLMYLSPAWYTMFGYAPKSEPQPVGFVASAVHPDDLERVTATLRRSVGDGAPYVVEARMRCADGSYRWIESRGRVTATDATGRATRVSGTNSNIDERKRAEAEKASLEAQLRQAQKMESVGRLAGGVAHDFNNMLVVIRGYTELVMEHLDPSLPIQDDLRQIHTAAERSAALTRQLLAFARKQVIAPEVLNLNDAVLHSLTMLQRLIGENVSVSWQPAPQLWRVSVDRSQLDQLLANLCVNARDAMADVGTIEISTSNVVLDAAACERHIGAVPGEYVCLTVTDNGRGMDAATMEQVFEPFFTTKEMGDGTGLGLSMVYGVVQQNRGVITVESTVGAGSTFSIFLPRHRGAVASARTRDAAATPERGHETVLLVEDEPAILRLASVALERHGYTVLAAASPSAALRLAATHDGPIDLLLSDVIMPEMNGRELSELLQQSLPGLKVLFMSGYPADVIANRGVLGDSVNFIAKPFSVAGLAERIREVLDRA